MDFEQFKSNLDARLGLRSVVFEDADGHQYLEYLSPTGMLLFSLYVQQKEDGWVIQSIGDVIPEVKF